MPRLLLLLLLLLCAVAVRAATVLPLASTTATPLPAGVYVAPPSGCLATASLTGGGGSGFWGNAGGSGASFSVSWWASPSAPFISSPALASSGASALSGGAASALQLEAANGTRLGVIAVAGGGGGTGGASGINASAGGNAGPPGGNATAGGNFNRTASGGGGGGTQTNAGAGGGFPDAACFAPLSATAGAGSAGGRGAGWNNATVFSSAGASAWGSGGAGSGSNANRNGGGGGGGWFGGGGGACRNLGGSGGGGGSSFVNFSVARLVSTTSFVGGGAGSGSGGGGFGGAGGNVTLLSCAAATVLPSQAVPFDVPVVLSSSPTVTAWQAPAAGCNASFLLSGGGGSTQGQVGAGPAGAGANFSVSVWLPGGTIITAQGTSPPGCSAGGAASALAYANGSFIAVAGGGGGALVPCNGGDAGLPGGAGAAGTAATGGTGGGGGTQTAGGAAGVGGSACSAALVRRAPASGAWLAGGNGAMCGSLIGCVGGVGAAAGGAGYNTNRAFSGGGGGGGWFGGGGGFPLPTGSGGAACGGGGSSFVAPGLAWAARSPGIRATNSSQNGVAGTVLLAACVPAPCAQPVYASATLAGTGSPGSTNGIGTGASFSGPAYLALDEARGLLYVSEQTGQSLRLINLATAAVTTLISGTTDVDGVGSNARMASGGGVALSGDTLFFVSWSGQRVRQLNTSSALVTTLAGSTTGHADGIGSNALFNGPRGIAVDAVNRLVYVCEYTGYWVRRLNLTSRLVISIAGTGAAGSADNANPLLASFNGPDGMRYDGVGALIIAEQNVPGKIRRVELTPQGAGAVTTLHSAGASSPHDVQIDNSNGLSALLYVNYAAPIGMVRLDAGNGYSASLALGNRSGAADGVGTAASFVGLLGLATTANGLKTYITDFSNHRIRVANLICVPPASATSSRTPSPTTTPSGTPAVTTSSTASLSFGVSSSGTVGASASASATPTPSQTMTRTDSKTASSSVSASAASLAPTPSIPASTSLTPSAASTLSSSSSPAPTMDPTASATEAGAGASASAGVGASASAGAGASAGASASASASAGASAGTSAGASAGVSADASASASAGASAGVSSSASAAAAPSSSVSAGGVVSSAEAAGGGGGLVAIAGGAGGVVLIAAVAAVLMLRSRRQRRAAALARGAGGGGAKISSEISGLLGKKVTLTPAGGMNPLHRGGKAASAAAGRTVVMTVEGEEETAPRASAAVEPHGRLLQAAAASGSARADKQLGGQAGSAPAALALDDALPEGWTEAFSKSKNLPYWRHTDGSTTWTRPALTVVAGAGGDGSIAAASSSLPEGWTEAFSKSKGRAYWRHTDGSTTWTMPTRDSGGDSLVEAVAELPSALPAGWVEAYSNSKQRPYWRNTDTQETSWVKPQ